MSFKQGEMQWTESGKHDLLHNTPVLLAIPSEGFSRVLLLCSHFKEPKQSVEFLSAESDMTADGIHKYIIIVYFIYRNYSENFIAKL